MNNYLILPGFGNSGDNHWQTFFETQLDNCKRIEQLSWDNPIMSDWIENINIKVSGYNRENLIVITHSLGGIALAHCAVKYPTLIKGALIVAPPDIEFPCIKLPLDTFLPIPVNKLPFPSLIIASTNDPWATIERTQLFANNWGSEVRFIGNAGHINADSGHFQWFEGIDFLRSFEKTL
jgi:predicted alpha/beta hydrolase family esterase